MMRVKNHHIIAIVLPEMDLGIYGDDGDAESRLLWKEVASLAQVATDTEPQGVGDRPDIGG